MRSIERRDSWMVVGFVDILKVIQYGEEYMRTMLRWTVPVEKGNETIKDGTLQQTIEALAQQSRRRCPTES